jgi:replicative DNA helicase
MSNKSTTPEFIYDSVNEQIIIEAAKSSPELMKRLVHQISPSQFLVPVHGPIWRALKGISDRSLELTPEVANQFILKEGGDESAVEYFNSLNNFCVENLEFHIETFEWDSTRSKILKTSLPKFISVLQDPKASREDVEIIANNMRRTLKGGGRRHLYRPSETYQAYMAELETRKVAGIYPLGQPIFDKFLSQGFIPGNTTVAAGLSSAGKSTVWIAFAIMLAKQGRKVLWCCWEARRQEVIDIANSHLTGIPLTKIVQGDYSSEEKKRLSKSTRWIVSNISFMGNPFYDFDDNQIKTYDVNNRNIDTLEGYIAESGCDLVVYDLWERVLGSLIPDHVTRSLYRMQYLHAEFSVHGIILQQINLKEVENRKDKRPTRESIKGVGSFVEIADLIFGIHREGQFKRVPDQYIETICMKQRMGRANWAIRWDWDGPTCFIGNPKEVPYDPGLENADEINDIASIQTKFLTKKSNGRRRR